MKKVFLTLLAIVVAFGLLGGAGFVGYRIGVRQGLQANSNGIAPRMNRFPQFNQNGMSQFHQGMNNRNFNRGFAPDHFSMMGRGGRMGFFPPFQFLWWLLIIGLLIWLGYKLFTGKGWQLSLTRHSADVSAEEPAAPKRKTAKTNVE